MRAVVQRVLRAEVRVEGEVVGRINAGLLVYVGSADGDSVPDIEYIANKVASLRIFPDEAGKMNRCVRVVGGGVLLVPAFTTMADAREGRRPAFIAAARPEQAEPNFNALCAALSDRGVDAHAGRFGAMMEVESVNDGPICVLLDSRRLF